MDGFVLDLLSRLRCSRPNPTGEGIEAHCGYQDCPAKGRAFRVNTTTHYGKWICHGCHRYGDIYDLIQLAIGVKLAEAREIFKERKVTRFVLDRLTEPPPPPPEELGLRDYVPFRRVLSNYLVEERKYRPDDIWEYRMGFDEYKREIVAPTFDWQGRTVVGISRRRVGPKQAFIHSPFPDKSLHLYGLDVALRTRSSSVVVVEGQLDVLGLRPYYPAPAVATFGSFLSQAQAALLVRFFDNVILAYDNDVAGIKGTRAAIRLLRQNGSTNLRILDYNASDPGDLPRIREPPTFALVVPSVWLLRHFRNGVPV